MILSPFFWGGANIRKYIDKTTQDNFFFPLGLEFSVDLEKIISLNYITSI